MSGLALEIGPSDDREAKLALVRKLILAIGKQDEHAALDALETFLDERGDPPAASDDEEG